MKTGRKRWADIRGMFCFSWKTWQYPQSTAKINDLKIRYLISGIPWIRTNVSTLGCTLRRICFKFRFPIRLKINKLLVTLSELDPNSFRSNYYRSCFEKLAKLWMQSSMDNLCASPCNKRRGTKLMFKLQRKKKDKEKNFWRILWKNNKL